MFTSSDLEKIIDSFADIGLVFSNEQDFQFQLGKELKELSFVKEVYFEMLSLKNSYLYIHQELMKDPKYKLTRDVKEYYDLMSAVMVCLGEESDREQGGILKLLNILFSTESKAREKQEILEREFSIKMTKTLKREVALMCNLSQWVEEKGIKKGMERGIEATVSVLKELGINEDVILEKVKEKFSLTESQAKKYVM